MSRALDPQLHTHVVAANLARGSDGRFTALHGSELYRTAQTAGFLYQAHLRALVSERLGLKWGEVNKGAADLEAVPPLVLEEFSKRRQEMIRAAEEGGIGLESKASAESAALMTRERKQYGVSTHTWREEVRARAGELGLGTLEVQELLEAGRDRVLDGTARVEAVDEAAAGDFLAGPDGLTERSNTFDERAVIRGFAGAARQGAAVGAVRGQAGRFTGRPDVLQISEGEMTTADLVASERRLIDAAVGRAREGAATIDAEEVDRLVALADRRLTGEQAAAVRATVAGGDGVSVIQALAGTGKTYTAGVLREVYERGGYQVIGVAPTGRAVRELSEEAGVSSLTLDRLLLGLEQLDERLPTRGVLIFDEAGMAATRPSARLLAAAQTARVKVIAIGDPGQLSSVQAGGWLAAISQRLGAPRLTEVLRQRDRAERQALCALHGRLPRQYLQWATSAGRIRTFNDPSAACEQAVSRWGEAAAAAEQGRVVMIARDNDTRSALNAAARELWRTLGRLGPDHTYGRLGLAVGDRVICRRNERSLNVDNGTRGTITRLHRSAVMIRTDGGADREIPASYAEAHLEHAYALTGHGMQGGTVEKAFVVASPRDLTAGWSYTALSRARADTHLLIHDQHPHPDREEHAPREHAASTPQELLARAARRMLERDDEDLATDQIEATSARSTENTSLGTAERAVAATGSVPTADPGAAAAAMQLMGELQKSVELLEERLAALPTRQLRRLEDLEQRAATLAVEQQDLRGRIELLPQRPRRLGRARGADTLERSHLSSALEASGRETSRVGEAIESLRGEIGESAAMRVGRRRLQAELADLTRQRAAVRDQLIDSEVEAPGRWVLDTFGERPHGARGQEIWKDAVRQAARYRAEHGITDPDTALGHRPQTLHMRRGWERAQERVRQSTQRLGRATPEHGQDNSRER